MGRDLTKGNIVKQILFFAIPIFLGSIFQHVYSITDAVIVGRYLGKNAFAAIDATAIVMQFFNIIFTGFSIGTGILIANYYGAKNYNKIFKLINNIMGIAIFLAFFTSVLGLIFLNNILSFLKIPEVLKAMSYEYLKISFLGIIFSYVYNMGTGILRSLGDSKTPFYYLIISCILNIFLDLFFVSILNYGVKGVAIATMISQFILTVLLILRLRKLDENYRLDFKNISIYTNVTKEILKKGLPLMLQAMVYPISNVFIQRAINSFGENLVAAWAIVGKIDSIFFYCISAISAAVVTFIAQNNGALKYDRINKSIVNSIVILGITIIFFNILLYFKYETFSLFLINDTLVSELSKMVYNIFAPFYLVFGIAEIFESYVKGIGETFYVMLFSICSICVPRFLFSIFVIPFNISEKTLFSIYPITWLIYFISSVSLYFYFRKRVIKNTLKL